MLIAAFIFVLSFAALIQFVALQWRAGLVRLASTPFAGDASGNLETAYNLFKNKAFSDVAALQKLCPTMGSSAPKLHSVRLYHSFLQLFSSLGAAQWAKSEMDLCARYAAAVLMQQVQSNQALAVQASSF
jgi:hypothetical protein